MTDRRTDDGCTDERMEKMLLSHNLNMRGSDVASLVEFRGLGGDSVTDKWMDDGRTDGRTHRKLMLLSHTLAMRGSDVASLVEVRPVV